MATTKLRHIQKRSVRAASERVRYEVDPYNRLVETRGDALRRFRTVLDGKFTLDKSNTLTYHIKAPRGGDVIPRQLKLAGRWSLTDDHELRLTLDTASRRSFGDAVTLQGQIINVGAGSLSFAITTITKGKAQSTYVLTFDGTWHADQYNRLTFHIRREKSRSDVVTLTGSWSVDDKYEIIYTYEHAALIRTKHTTQTLSFKGYWRPGKDYQISYVLSAATGSVFTFAATAAVGTPKYIRYEFGTSISARPKARVPSITLFGAWRLCKNVGLLFEVGGADGRIQTLTFGATATLSGTEMITFRLTDDITHRDIGLTVELSRKLLGGTGEAFVRALVSRSALSFTAGAAWRW